MRTRNLLGYLLAIAALAPAGCVDANGKPGAQNGKNDINRMAALSPPPAPPTVYIDPTKVQTRDDIVRIHQFFPNFPWLTDAEGRVIGFQSSVYFVSAATENKGAFVPGTILIWLYQVKRTPGVMSPEHELLYGWELSATEAMGFRVRKEAKTGFYYGFVLKWPAQLDLTGREIEIVFGYDRKDGNLIQGSPKRFRVPLVGGYSPTPAVRPTPARAPAGDSPQAQPPQPATGRPDVRKIE